MKHPLAAFGHFLANILMVGGNGKKLCWGYEQSKRPLNTKIRHVYSIRWWRGRYTRDGWNNGREGERERDIKILKRRARKTRVICPWRAEEGGSFYKVVLSVCGSTRFYNYKKMNLNNENNREGKCC